MSSFVRPCPLSLPTAARSETTMALSALLALLGFLSCSTITAAFRVSIYRHAIFSKTTTANSISTSDGTDAAKTLHAFKLGPILRTEPPVLLAAPLVPTAAIQWTIHAR